MGSINSNVKKNDNNSNNINVEYRWLNEWKNSNYSQQLCECDVYVILKYGEWLVVGIFYSTRKTMKKKKTDTKTYPILYTDIQLKCCII